LQYDGAVTKLSALALVVLQGCSFAFVSRTRSQPPAEPISCTQSRTAPVVDTVLAVLMAGGVMLFADDSFCEGEENPGDCKKGAKAAAVTAGIESIAFGFSAWYGYRHTSQCRQAVHEQQAYTFTAQHELRPIA
jgi:hypothetical protein